MQTGSRRPRTRGRANRYRAAPRGGAAAFLLPCALLLASIAGTAYLLMQARAEEQSMERLRAAVAADGPALIHIRLAGGATSTESAAPPVPEAETDAPPSAESETSAPNAVEAETQARLAGYAALQAENPELFGWLSMPGTKVDDPVMYSPERPRYYLRRDFEGKRASGGMLFVDENCRPYENARNLIIYGHNMKNGTRFGELEAYLDAEFLRAHRTFTFDTPSRAGEYEIVSVYRTELDANAAFKFYRYPVIQDEETFAAYFSSVTSRSLHQEAWSVRPGDELLTLVTCSYHAPEGRLIVVGRRIGSGEDAADAAYSNSAVER